ncbi:MAG TPA: DNA polymerase IV [Bdellovibrio sp.]
MKKIIHVDMDCFYAAVEVKYNPELKGKPLGIGGPPNSRSVLCTASYEARKFGVRAAMSSSQAVRLCPQLILVPPHFDLYKTESRKVREILERFTNKIEPLSLDEAYLDVSDCQQFGGSATLIAQEIRRLIFTELKLTASAGVAPNKFLAKIASDWKKPNGQFVVRPQDVEGFVKDLPVEKIFGVGKVTAQKMHDLGLFTCGDIQKYSVAELHTWFGSRAQELYDFARGEDQREVITEWERKSLTVEETFNKDLQTLEECRKTLPSLYEDFIRRLEKGEYQDRVRGMVVKLKFYDFKQTTHEEVCHEVPSQQDFQRLLEKAWERRGVPVRLVGLGVRLGSQKSSTARVDNSQLRFAI